MVFVRYVTQHDVLNRTKTVVEICDTINTNSQIVKL